MTLSYRLVAFLCLVAFWTNAHSQVDFGAIRGWGNIGFGQNKSSSMPVQRISGGGNTFMAVKADGTLACWGVNSSAQCNVPIGEISFVQAAAGDSHSVGLTSDGRVVCWGDNSQGQLAVPNGLTSAVGVAAGAQHTLALQSNGKVLAWGRNTDAYGPAGQATAPAGLAGVIQVSAGQMHSVALNAAGMVIAWGSNKDPVGGFSNQSKVPDGLGDVIQVAAGGYHNVALRRDGSVVCWGYNGSGQCSVPPGATNVIQVAAGYAHSVALTADGRLLTWGSNQFGQCSVPSSDQGVSCQVAANYFGTCVLRSDGTIDGFGDARRLQTYPPPNLQGAIQVATTGLFEARGSALNYRGHTAVITPFGNVLCFGENGTGQCAVPINLGGVFQVAVGSGVTFDGISWWFHGHTVSLRVGGTVNCWGDNSFGQCNVPAGLANVVQVAAGSRHTVALRSDGTVVAWGANDYGQCTVPSGVSGIVEIAAGAFHTLARRQDGTVFAWGADSFGQAHVPASANHAVALAAGYGFSSAVQPDGSVVAWGVPAEQPPVGIGGVNFLAAGGNLSVALRGDGTVTAWGDPSLGATKVPAGLAGIAQVSAGSHHAMAVGAVSLFFHDGVGTATLSTKPTAMTAVQLTCDNSDFQVPSSLIFSPGVQTVDFNYSIAPAASVGVANVKATFGSASQTASFFIGVSDGMATVAFPSPKIVGGLYTIATAHLHTPTLSVGKVGTVFTITSTSELAVPVFSTMLIPDGATSFSFLVATTAVDADTDVELDIESFQDSGSGSGTTTIGSGRVTLQPYHVVSLSVYPTAVPGGNTAIATAKLNAIAGSSGVSLTTDVGSSFVASVDGNANVAPGQDSTTFNVYTAPHVDSGLNAVTVDAMVPPNDFGATAGLDVVHIMLTTFYAPPLVSGTAGKGMIATDSDYTTTFDLSSDNAAVIVDSQVSASNGAPTAFGVSAAPVDDPVDATITASQVGSVAGTVGVHVNPATISSLTFSPNPVPSGGALKGTVTLNGLAGPSGVTVNLTSGSAYLKVPASVQVPSGKNTVQFDATTGLTGAQTSVTVTASSVYSSDVKAVVSLTPVTLASLTLSPATVVGGVDSIGTVTLTSARSVPVVLSLSSVGPNVTVPASLTIPANSTSATFMIHTVGVDIKSLSTISAWYLATAKTTANLTIVPAGILKVVVAPNPIAGGSDGAATVYLTGKAGPSGVPLVLSTTLPSIAVIQPTGKIPSGGTSAAFVVKTQGVDVNTVVSVYARIGAGAVFSGNTAILAAGVARIYPWPVAPVVGGNSFNLVIYLTAKAGPSGVVVSLSDDKPNVIPVPSSVTVPPGSIFKAFSTPTHGVSAPTVVTIRGNTNGTTAQIGTVTVTP